MADARPAALHVVFKGRVQGVGFRHHVSSNAAALGVTGWIRNRLDGTVEAQMVGEGKAINELLRRCRTGLPAADVKEAVVQQGLPPDPLPTGFVQRPTI